MAPPPNRARRFMRIPMMNRRLRAKRADLVAPPQMGQPSTGLSPAMDPPPEVTGLCDIVERLRDVEADQTVTVRKIVEELGASSFVPLILVPALALVSPLSGIFGLSTLGAIFMLLVTVQKLLGRPHVWLPQFLKRREIPAHRLRKTMTRLHGPACWIDARTHQRFSVLVSPAANMLTLLVIAAICLLIPFLEVLPMVTSIFAAAISFFAVGLLARDGLFTLLGYIQVAVSLGLITWLVSESVS